MGEWVKEETERGGGDEVRNVDGWRCCGAEVRIMIVDRSRGGDSQAVSSSTNRRMGFPLEDWTHTPERDGRSDIISVCMQCVCTCLLYSSEDGDIKSDSSHNNIKIKRPLQ